MPIHSNQENMQITSLSLSLWSLVTTDEMELVSMPLLLLA